ncbi:MAG: NADH-quinone oxidoreductase subunit C [bacterium]
MSSLKKQLKGRFADQLVDVREDNDCLCIEIQPDDWVEVARALKTESEFSFGIAIDLCAVDYLGYGEAEWDTHASVHGFSRGVSGTAMGRFDWEHRPHESVPRRFAVVVHLLSVENNQRLRMKCYLEDLPFPLIPSLTEVWNGLNWFEREAFDLLGVVFEGHPDLRRILTDYGFVGHPFRKDFPLVGNVEMRYDEKQKRVLYQPCTLEPRVTVPKTIREDARYVNPGRVNGGQKDG